MHHFAGLPFGARPRVYLGITHQSFSLAGISGASVEGGERREVGVPAVPPLWPLTAPSNERRHSHTNVHTPSWSPFLPPLLPSSLFLPSVNLSGAPGNALSPPSLRLLHCLLLSPLFHLSQDLSPLLSHTAFSPAVSSCWILSILCRKQPFKRHFYWSVWKVELPWEV